MSRGSAFVKVATDYLGNGDRVLFKGLQTWCEEPGLGHVCCSVRASEQMPSSRDRQESRVIATAKSIQSPWTSDDEEEKEGASKQPSSAYILPNADKNKKISGNYWIKEHYCATKPHRKWTLLFKSITFNINCLLPLYAISTRMHQSTRFYIPSKKKYKQRQWYYHLWLKFIFLFLSCCFKAHRHAVMNGDAL